MSLSRCSGALQPTKNPIYTSTVCTVTFAFILVLYFSSGVTPAPSKDSFLKLQYTAAPFAFPQLYQCRSPPLPGPYKTLSSQGKEDIFLWDNLFSKTLPADYEGTFLEIGAVDGFGFSNTRFYEHYLNWRGLLFDAFPNSNLAYEAKKSGRPRSRYFAMSICGLSPFWDGQKASIKFLNRSSGSAVATALEEGYSSSKFLDVWHPDPARRTTVSVGCMPMQSILEMTGILDIDLFSLDVEGGELMIVRTI
ncbi:hypothetical protein DFJ74DRAFT_651220, partial [Hyaloraphidium curvatum]